MPSHFNIPSGADDEPIRQNAKLRETLNSSGDRILEGLSGESINLSPTGINQIKVYRERWYHCGCNAEKTMGGKCAIPGCHNISCETHFAHCEGCHVPLCIFHLRNSHLDGKKQDLCPDCFGKLKRRRTLRSIFTNLLKPFVEFNEGEGK